MIGLDCISDQKVVQMLRLFFRHKQDYTGHQMSKLLGTSSNTCTKYLEQLVTHRILDKRILGRAYVYQLSNSYMTRELLAPLFEKEEILLSLPIQCCRDTLTPHVKALILYGQFAYKNRRFTPDIEVINKPEASDGIELCCIVPELSDTFYPIVDELSDHLESEFAILLRPYIISHSEFNKKRDFPLIQRILNEGQLLFETL